MRFHRLALFLSLTAIASTLLAACASPAGPTPTVQPTAPPTPTLEPSPTPLPPRELNICLGQEPQTLYLYGGSSRGMWSVLEAVYDGPIDTRGYMDQPVILQELPDQTNGGAIFHPITVQRGQKVVDEDGNLTYLDTGTRVRPAGCHEDACAAAWDGTAALELDQLSLTFKLKSGLLWSDGQPLTASDSVYSFKLASDPATPISRTLLDRTSSYQAEDETSVVWTGLPGYNPNRPADLFFTPLPEHAWSKFSPAELLTAPESSRSPLGWGAYIIDEWKQGEYLRLRINPNYFRVSEGLPHFDILTYHFLGDQADNNLTALAQGVCDIVDQTVQLEGQLYTVRDLENQGKLKSYNGLGPEWEHLDFGIRPAAYDKGYNPWGGYRQDLFSDVRVRQAFEYCLDRQQVIDNLLYGRTQIPAGFFPPGHPLYLADMKPLPYDPAEGARLLEQAGWRDLDGDPATPRTSLGIANVLTGTPLAITYLTTPDQLGKRSADILAASLAGCGIGVEVQATPLEQLFAPGPGGSLFGRTFDLAQFSWASGRSSPCFLYASDQIPSAENGWLGVNVTGFTDEQYDTACRAALQADPQKGEAYQTAQAEVQRLYADLTPSIPLFYALHLDVSRPDLCHFEMDTSARSEFWNIEALDYGEGCP